MQTIQALRGMKDLLEQDQVHRYKYFLQVASKLAENYNFHFVKLPLLEETALFKRSVGDSSDIVGKEMYEFIDKSNKSVCLRPEGTAGMVRSLISNGLDKQAGVKRFFYHGSMFRYERPQKGRLREFSQFGCEVFGSNSVEEDFLLIHLLVSLLNTLGIDFEILLNSLGCKLCKNDYIQVIVEVLKRENENICQDCQRRIATNPLRVLDCKNDECQNIYHQLPSLLDYLCQDCEADFKQLQELLKQHKIDFSIDKKLVRGLDYYNKTAFEFVSSAIGAKSSICGGGRYDDLVQNLGGKPSYAVGFAIGIERLLELIKMPLDDKKGFYMAALCEEALSFTMNLTLRLRQKHFVIDQRKVIHLGKHLNLANKTQVKFVCIVGIDEIKHDQVLLKDLVNGEQELISIKDLEQRFL